MDTPVESLFGSVVDFRSPWKVIYRLCDILFIALCTLVSNGEDFEDMESFGKERREWLLQFIELPNGTPSHDTFNRVFQLLDPSVLIEILKNDGFDFIHSLVGTHITIDGKKVKGYSPKSRGNKGLYIEVV